MNDQIKDTIQDCNINFLIGSGLSFPFLKTLGNIEALLTELEKKSVPNDKKKLIKASLYKAYFDGVIAKNLQIVDESEAANTVLAGYQNFLHIWNSILLRRKSTILGKEVNIFTTNVDVFLEKALEDLGLEYNDGFNGRFKPSFSLSNFKKSRFKRSLHYDNIAEMPVFNLLKLHGSLCWELDKNDEITFSPILTCVRATVSTTAMIEIVRHTQRNVKRWQDGDMRKRWTAAGMLVAEQQFRRIIGYRDLATLVIAIERHAARTAQRIPTTVTHTQVSEAVTV